MSRGFRRKCPRCGEPAFETWYRMKVHCSRCGVRFEREPGYWVGAVVLNTVVIFATFLIVFGTMVAITYPDVPWGLVMAVTVVTNLVVPFVFYPISKTLWAGLEMSWHPLESDEVEAAARRLA
jgi:uncharacterized protein (DUF983 family)